MDTKGFDLRYSILGSAAVISSPVLLALGTMAFAITAQAQPGHPAAGRQVAVSPAQAQALSGDVTDRVIVVFKDQLAGLPDTATDAAARSGAVGSVQRGVLSELTRSGAAWHQPEPAPGRGSAAGPQ
jgi:hypothetical protein